jgi:hypothetical protein
MTIDHSLNVKCPKCGATIHETCIAPSGRPARNSHQDRIADYTLQHIKDITTRLNTLTRARRTNT